MDANLNTVYRYHEETKHHFQRYARSLGFLDWSTQPDPFRRFAGAPITQLEMPPQEDGPTWDGLFAGDREAVPVTPASISRFFYFSLALSAWKEVLAPSGKVASRWALRVNPSSGNLHPTEGYLVGPDGVFHYGPETHVLEQRGAYAGPEWSKFAKNQPNEAFLVGLTSIHWREAWKYGERAFRYCQHDVGHALAALSLSAACLGWQTRLAEGWGTEVIERLLGVREQVGPEKEHGDCLVRVWPGPAATDLARVELPEPASWTGTPNRLSEGHQEWPIIQEIAAVTRGQGGPAAPSIMTRKTAPRSDRGLSAQGLIRNRRSAVSLDGTTGLPRNDFFDLLERLMPHQDHPVFGAAPDLNHVSLAIFAHRVDGLDPGLYVLVRHPDHEASLRAAMREDFSWTRPEGCPADLPLFLLGRGDLRHVSRQLSCGQDIAADGAFSLGMLARFDHALTNGGAEMYPRLFWETGMIGQMLYLEAEAAGRRGTGIGCFFDDEVHKVLGIADHTWQSLYHFTVGGAIEDTRLRTGPAY